MQRRAPGMPHAARCAQVLATCTRKAHKHAGRSHPWPDPPRICVSSKPVANFSFLLPPDQAKVVAINRLGDAFSVSQSQSLLGSYTDHQPLDRQSQHSSPTETRHLRRIPARRVPQRPAIVQLPFFPASAKLRTLRSKKADSRSVSQSAAQPNVFSFWSHKI